MGPAIIEPASFLHFYISHFQASIVIYEAKRQYYETHKQIHINDHHPLYDNLY